MVIIMKKMHTRVKRKLDLTSGLRHRKSTKSTRTENRPKSHASEEKAHEAAKRYGHAKGEYEIKTIREGKKYHVIPKKKE